MKIKKVVETCIYSSDLESMLLIFDPLRTKTNNGSLPAHGTPTPPSSIHFAMEIEEQEYHASKQLLIDNNIAIEKEVNWDNHAKSIYFRDPAGNLVELITPGGWP